MLIVFPSKAEMFQTKSLRHDNGEIEPGKVISMHVKIITFPIYLFV